MNRRHETEAGYNRTRDSANVKPSGAEGKPDVSTARTPDQQVEAALYLLRQAAPPEQMERRILRRLAAPSAQRSSRLRLLSTWRWPAFAMAAALTLAFVSLHRSAAPRPEQPHALAPLPAHVPTASSGFSVLVEGRHPRSATPAAAFSTRSSPLAKPQSTRAVAPAQVFAAAKPLPEAVFDHPAPELPLTAQERLLLRIAYGDRPLQMAAGKRFVLPRSSEDDIDFNHFFEPYTTPLTEGYPH